MWLLIFVFCLCGQFWQRVFNNPAAKLLEMSLVQWLWSKRWDSRVLKSPARLTINLQELSIAGKEVFTSTNLIHSSCTGGFFHHFINAKKYLRRNVLSQCQKTCEKFVICLELRILQPSTAWKCFGFQLFVNFPRSVELSSTDTKLSQINRR